jgi:hypothetical protein
MKCVKNLFVLLIFLCCIAGNAVAAAEKTNVSASDKLYSDKYVLGFEKKSDADVFKDLNVKNTESVAVSLPTYNPMVLVIILVFIVVIVSVVLALLWNTGKMSKAATDDNADEASKKIHKHRRNNKELMEGVAWSGFFILSLVFIIIFLR